MSTISSKASLGFWSATFLVVANMIGAGIFTTSGYSLGSLGDREWVMLAWLVGGIVALCGAWSYGCLASFISESGGEYLFLTRLIHPAAGFLAGWVSLIAGFTGAIAYAATTFATYLLPSNFEGQLWTKGLALLVLGTLTLLHIFHLRGGLLTQNIVVVLKLALLTLFLGFATTTWLQGGWEGVKAVDKDSAFSLASFAGSMVWISLSFSGFNAAVYVAGEVKNAKRIVPRALVAGTAIVTLLYLMLNAVFLYAPLPGDIENQETVAAIAAKTLGGDWLEYITRAVICLATLSSVSAMVIAGPRVYVKMAEDGVLPSIFKKRSETEFASSPIPAILLQAGLAAVVIVVAGLQDQLGYLGFTLSLSAALTVGTVFVAAFREGKLFGELPRVQFWIAMPCAAIYVIATLILAVLAASNQPWQFGAAALTIVGGLTAYLIFKLVEKNKENPVP